MRICYFGDYDPEYPRHRTLLRGLRENGAEVHEVRIDFRGFRKYVAAVRLLLRARRSVDIIMVAYARSRIIPLVKLISLKPVVWDAFYSLYDNRVFDRQWARPGSLKARYYWLNDYVNCLFSDAVMLDTNENINYFVSTFRLPPSKFVRVLIGVDDSVMRPFPKRRQDDSFVVEFHGKYIPVQGTEFIIRAAELLKHENVQFIMIGDGQEYRRIRTLASDLALDNVRFVPKLPFEEIPPYIADSDVCIGLVGNVPRTGRAIPNKVYEAAAMKKPSINANTPAIHELFADRISIMLCKMGDPHDIARCIRELMDDSSLKERIGEAAYAIVKAKAFPGPIGRDLHRYINRRFKANS